MGIANHVKINSNLEEPFPLEPDPVRWRELFPLPVQHQAGLSVVSARRRRARVRGNVERTNSVIQVLNEMRRFFMFLMPQKCATSSTA
jgi:hypothetical protein